MHKHPIWLSVWRFSTKYWNAVLAALACSGLAAGQLFPTIPQPAKDAALFVGASAILWTLIELKLHLIDRPRANRHPTMRGARTEIVDSIRHAIQKSKRRNLRIRIIGGRIRTISDMLGEIFDDIAAGSLNASNVAFDVVCINPRSMRNWEFSGVRDPEGFRDRMHVQSRDIEMSAKGLLDVAQRSGIKERNITINIAYYDRLPAIYAFVIGHQEIYWGYYTWNYEQDDFDGPVNPCYRATPRSEEFSDLYEWFQNYAKYSTEWSSSSNVFRAGEMPCAITLAQVVKINTAAYDELAEEYKSTAMHRVPKMKPVIDPFVHELESRFEEISLLEIGPGDGGLCQTFADRGYSVTAIDVSHRMVESTQYAAPGAKVVHGDFATHRFSQRRFSAVVAIAFVHLFPSEHLKQILHRISSILDEHGIALISTTLHNRSEQGFYQKITPRVRPMRFRRRFTRDELEDALEAGGFRVVSTYENEDGTKAGKQWVNYVLEKISTNGDSTTSTTPVSHVESPTDQV